MQDWEREKLQKAIISRSKSLADLKHHWNQHAPINRLPPELLEKVFILTRNETLALFSTAAELASDDQRVANVTAEFYREQPYLWTSVALVCRHWRDIALHYSKLWTVIFVTIRPCVFEMLARSQKHPLRVFMPFSPSHRARRKVYSEIYRVIELVLFVKPKTCVAELPKSAPALSTLRLGVCDKDQPSPPAFEDWLRTADMPHLQHLEIYSCRIGWDKHVLRNTLARLILVSYRKVARPPNMIAFLDALKTLPLLEYLEMRYTLPSFSETGPVVRHEVALNRLLCLHLVDSWILCAQTLRMLSLPSVTSISVAGEYLLRLPASPHTEDLVVHVLGAWSAKLTDDRRIRTAHFNDEFVDDRWCRVLRCWSTFDSKLFMSPNACAPPPLLKLIFNTRAQDPLALCFNAIPFNHLLSLSIHSRRLNPPSTVPSLSKWFRGMPKLRELSLAGWIASSECLPEVIRNSSLSIDGKQSRNKDLPFPVI